MASLVLVYLDHCTSNNIRQQVARNHRLQQEIRQCQKNRIIIKRLVASRNTLTSRLHKIYLLHASQRESVNFLYELAALVPDQVALQKIERRGDKIVLSGNATNNQGISDFMHNLMIYHKARAPDLPAVNTAFGKNNVLHHYFTLDFKLKNTERNEHSIKKYQTMAHLG